MPGNKAKTTATTSTQNATQICANCLFTDAFEQLATFFFEARRVSGLREAAFRSVEFGRSRMFRSRPDADGFLSCSENRVVFKSICSTSFSTDRIVGGAIGTGTSKKVRRFAAGFAGKDSVRRGSSMSSKKLSLRSTARRLASAGGRCFLASMSGACEVGRRAGAGGRAAAGIARGRAFWALEAVWPIARPPGGRAGRRGVT